MITLIKYIIFLFATTTVLAVELVNGPITYIEQLDDTLCVVEITIPYADGFDLIYRTGIRLEAGEARPRYSDAAVIVSPATDWWIGDTTVSIPADTVLWIFGERKAYKILNIH